MCKHLIICISEQGDLLHFLKHLIQFCGYITTLTLRLLMSYIYIYIYIYMERLFLMFLDHTHRLCCVVVCDQETSRIGAPYV